MPRAQFRDTVLLRTLNGTLIVPPVGAQASLYDAGTSNPIGDTIYADSSSATTLPNPVALGADGALSFWLAGERELDVLVACPGCTSLRTTVTTDGVLSQGLPGPVVAWRGTWAAGTDYTIYDAVAQDGSSYLAPADPTLGVQPPAAPWVLMASKGDQGIQGIQGIQGVAGPTGTVAAAGAGTAALPSISFVADPNTGLYNRNPDEIGLSTNGVDRWIANATQFQIGPTLAWGATPGAPDVFLVRDGANILAQRNGTNAQELRLYNTYTDASNYSRLVFRASGATGWPSLTTEAIGTGPTPHMQLGSEHASAVINFRTAGATRWQISAAGHLTSLGAMNLQVGGTLSATGPFAHTGSYVGFYGTAVQVKGTVSGSRGANAALASLLTALAGYGLLTDSSTA